MPDITVYVDGTTSGTAHAGGAHYATLAACVAAELPTNYDLVNTLGGTLTILCGNIADTLYVVFPSGLVTDASHKIIIKGNPVDIVTATNTGIWSTSRYRLSTSANFNTLDTAGTAYTEVYDLQVASTSYSGASSKHAIRCRGSHAICARNITINGGVGTSTSMAGIRSGSTDGTGQCYDNLVYGFGDTSDLGIEMFGATVLGDLYYNNTIINCVTAFGVINYGKGGTIKNSLVYGCTTFVSSTPGVRGDYNATDLASFSYNDSGAKNTHDLTSITNPFANSGATPPNYHLAAAVALIGAGIGPTSDSNVPSVDIDGQSRSGATTDIGADLYVAAGATVISATGLYNAGRLDLFNGVIDLDTSTIKMRLVPSTYSFAATHATMSDVGTGIGPDITLTGCLVGLLADTISSYFDADDLITGAIATGSTVGGIVIFKYGTGDSDSVPICFCDVTDQATNGGALSVEWRAPENGGIVSSQYNVS